MRPPALAALLALVSACSGPDHAPPGAGAPAAGRSAAPDARGRSLASWSREALSPVFERSGRQGPPTLTAPDRAALAEIVDAAPTAPRAPTAEGGGTKIGTDTGLPATPAPPPPPEAAPEPPRPRVQLGPIEVQPEMSTPAIEKAARAQLYWELVQRCRDPEGKILPPDAITLLFNIDPDGYILAPSIVATAKDPRHDEAAACIRRELSSTAFRGPAGARGLSTRVDATVPSVD